MAGGAERVREGVGQVNIKQLATSSQISLVSVPASFEPFDRYLGLAARGPSYAFNLRRPSVLELPRSFFSGAVSSCVPTRSFVELVHCVKFVFGLVFTRLVSHPCWVCCVLRHHGSKQPYAI